MTKIEELVRLLENRGRLGTDQYARLLALKALEALPELREAAGSCVENEEMIVVRMALSLVQAPGWEPSRPQEEELLSAVRRWLKKRRE